MFGTKCNLRVGGLARGIIAAAIVGLGGTAAFASSPPQPQFFDWSVPTEDGGANYTPSPFLDNNNYASVDAFLAARVKQDSRNLLAVKINTPITSSGAKAIFDKYDINYVFADFEDATAESHTQTLVSLVKGSKKSSGAFIGDFSMAPISNDPTRPSNLPPTTPTASGKHSAFTPSQYQVTKVNMAMPALYPGAPDFRNPAEGNSSAPNIRSALFVLPIQRLSLAEEALPPHNILVPWVSRFNNWGNSALDTDGNSSNGYQFVQNAANPANGQLLSRGDFEAQILHYRLRGADSVNLFNYNSPASSIIGYSSATERADALTGWNQSAVSTLFSRGHYEKANNGATDIINNSQVVSSESIGVIWSGAYDYTGSNRQLVILLSNLGVKDQAIDIPKVAGIATSESSNSNPNHDEYDISAGTHRILTFNLKSNKWTLASNTLVFTDNNRNGIGVPEPTSLGLIALGGSGLLMRRRRRV